IRFRYSSVRAWIAGSFVFPIHVTLIFTGRAPLRLFPTPEPRRRRTGSHPPHDTARSPPSPPRGSPATLPPEPVPASAGTELPRRRRNRKLLPRLPAKSREDVESTPLPREIPRRLAPSRERPRLRIEMDRILRVEAWLRPHAGAQSSSWFANKVVPSDPKRQNRHEVRAST